jgi:hypothetical protein
MKIHRGPRSSNRWTDVTATLSTTQYAQDWNPAKVLTVDATIDKSGERHSDMGIQFEEDDIVSLSEGFIAHIRKERDSLREEKTAREVLQRAMEKIHDLISYHSEKAPTTEKLVEAVKDLALHYYCNASDEDRPEIEWIKWENI